MSTGISCLTAITLRGSTETIAEFFFHSINSILYMRGVYPQDDFKMQKKYGLNVLVTTEPELLKYLETIMGQLKEWILQRSVQKLVLVIASVNSGEVLERWQFDLQLEGESASGATGAPTKTEKDVQQEIQAIIRQITASVTFLPMLEDVCSFDLLVYTSHDLNVPMQWGESDARLVKNGTELAFRGFSTSIHRVSTTVSYRNPNA